MFKSEDISKLIEALSKAQGAFPTIPKNKTANAGSYSYKYADLSDIIPALQKSLSDNGLAIIQTIEPGALHTILAHSSGQWIESVYELPKLGDRITSQIYGSFLTYGRRYSLSSLLSIAADEDDDGAEASKIKPTQQQKQPTPPKFNSKEEFPDFEPTADIKKPDESPDFELCPSGKGIGKKFTGKCASHIELQELISYVTFLENDGRIERNKPEYKEWIEKAYKWINYSIPNEAK